MNGASHGTQPAALLAIEDLSAGFETKTILRGISLAVPRRGVLGIMGPAGVGKSTLLRCLARWSEALPSFWHEGRVLLDGRDLLRDVPIAEAQERVALLAQKARLFTASVLENVLCDAIKPHQPASREARRELARAILAPFDLWETFEARLDQPIAFLSIAEQRRLSIARLAAGRLDCLLADEPLRDIPDGEATQVAAMLRRVAAERAVVLVTHNQREARALCDRIALLVDGRIVECAPVEEFFSAPRSTLAQDYILLGNCWPARPEEPDEPDEPDEEDDVRETPPPRPSAASASHAAVYPMPGGFHWVIPGLLGGMQRPGLLHSKDEDLTALRALGCRVLVNLTRRPSESEELERYGIEAVHEPIADMGVPTLEAAEDLVQRIAGWLDRGLPTVLHCKAGLGRTGTLLACTLVYRGENAVRAVGRVRAVNPQAIQTPEQLAFVRRFEEFLERSAPESPGAAGTEGEKPCFSE